MPRSKVFAPIDLHKLQDQLRWEQRVDVAMGDRPLSSSGEVRAVVSTLVQHAAELADLTKPSTTAGVIGLHRALRHAAETTRRLAQPVDPPAAKKIRRKAVRR